MEFSYLDTRSPDDWDEWELVNAKRDERGVALATELAPHTVIEDVDAIDIDVDDCRDLYVLDATGDVHRYDRTKGMERLLGLDGDRVTDPRALSVTADSIYVADGTDGFVRAYSKYRLQLRWISNEAFEDPVGIVHDGRYAYVLAAGTEPGDGLLARLRDCGASDLVVSGLTSPKDITIDGARNHYVLDSGPQDENGESAAAIRMFTGIKSDFDRTEPTDAANSPLKKVPAGTSCIEAIDVREVLAAVDSNVDEGTTLYRYLFEVGPPERGVSLERDCSMLVTKRGSTSRGIDGLYVIDDEANEVYFLEDGGKTRRNGRTSRYDAQIINRLDSGDQGTRWHRTKLDLDLQGRDTQVRLSYYATEDNERIDDSRDLRKIDGIGQGYADQLNDADVTWISQLASLNAEGVAERAGVSSTRAEQWIDHARELLVDWKQLGEPNPWDALLESAEGRYLWVKIELIGSKRGSPRVASFRAYFPRTSYLRYLPAIYRRDEVSEEFLERFLSIFESVFVDIEEEIGNVTRYMDPGGIVVDDLQWLGSWLALETDETWPKSARRELVARAPELFKKRGTREGLLEVLSLYLRHVSLRTAWREALEIDGETVIELVKGGAMTEREVAETLGTHATLRTISGEESVRLMIVAWSTVLERRRETLDRMMDAGFTSEKEVEEEREREAYEDMIRESDEGSLRYLLEYAGILEKTAELVNRGRISESEVTATQKEYEILIRETGNRNAPYLIEPSDLDCIDSEDVRKPYADLVGHDRGFIVLVRSSLGDEGMRTVNRIVDSEQPAHADGRVVELQPQIRLGGNSYLGINSALSKPKLVVGGSGLGLDSMLDDRETSTNSR